ncbi:MAG: hypothetical protein C0406_06445, partial [Sideroxydans sp.]|nr:hypothetical protein [Sideroxydans sp.]
TSEQKNRGRWKVGVSGNPKGRPTGTGEVAKLRDSIAVHIPVIIAELVTKAKAGDSQAARLLLERVLPSLKPMEQPVALPLPLGVGFTAQGEAIVRAVANGLLAPSQGAQLLAGLGTLVRIKEVDELAARISVLEGMKDADN